MNEENKNPADVLPPAPLPDMISGGRQNIPTSIPAPAPEPVLPTAPASVSAPVSTPAYVPPSISPSMIPNIPSVMGNVPPPPPPEIGIRTMDSDIKSMQASGGMGATAKTFKPEELFAKPTNSVINIPSIPSKPSSTPTNPIGSPVVRVIGPKKSNRKVIILAAIVVLLILVWVGIEFFVIPNLHQSSPAVTTTVPSNTIPVATTTQPAVVSFVHQSFFGSQVSPSTTISLISPLSLSALQAGVASSTSLSEPTGTFEELAFVNGAASSTSSSSPVTAQELMSAMLPLVSQDFLTGTFSNDVTGFAYYHNGARPGYVFKLNAGVDLANATSTLNPIIEANPGAFFQVSPGTISGTFNDGALPDGKAVRYATFSEKGTALEYGWFGGYLVISTSYQGLISADQRL